MDRHLDVGGLHDLQGVQETSWLLPDALIVGWTLAWVFNTGVSVCRSSSWLLLSHAQVKHHLTGTHGIGYSLGNPK